MVTDINSHGMTIKKITLVGRSNENFVQATENAIDRANDTMGKPPVGICSRSKRPINGF
jgi:hypothetical protein